MIPSLLCFLFYDVFSDHACVLLCVSIHLEAKLLTQEEILTQCGMVTQEWMTTQFNQASDTCMANGPNMCSNPTARRTQLSLPVFQALAPCETTSLQGQMTSPSLHSKVYAALVKTCAWRDTSHLHPSCARGTSLRASDSLDRVQNKLSPPKLRIPIPCYTKHHLALLHTSPRGNNPIGSSDLLDSGG